MITGFRRPLVRVVFGVLAVMTVACQRVALLAPAGSTITLTTLATTLPLSGTTNLIAQVIEPSGTPPQRGTLVTFTASLGSVEPVEAETDPGGRVMVTFNAGTQSGTATITALSGGVTTGATGAIKIAVGSAGVTNIAVSASPSSVSANGGTSTISATVADSGGNVVVGVPVSFSTDNGSLSGSVASTDATGTARVTLTTNKTSKVTATAGVASTSGTTTNAAPSASVTVNVNPLPTVTISSSTSNPTPNSPVAFTIAAAAAPGNTITSIVVRYGDGTSDSLSGNATSVSHVYSQANTYTITATATDNVGVSGAATTVIVVGSGAIAASFTFSPSSPKATNPVSFNASDSTPANGIVDYSWDFGDGTPVASGSNPATSHTYATANTFTVHLTVKDNASRTATTSKPVTVSP